MQNSEKMKMSKAAFCKVEGKLDVQKGHVYPSSVAVRGLGKLWPGGKL